MASVASRLRQPATAACYSSREVFKFVNNSKLGHHQQHHRFQQRQCRASSSTKFVSNSKLGHHHHHHHHRFQQRQCRSSSNTVYKFGVSQDVLETVKATLPLVAESGTDFTKHFYKRMFTANSELMNVFNQTNQTLGGQPKKLLKTVAVAAQAAITTGDLPGEAIESICQKHASLNVAPGHYDVVGENILGTIEDLLTNDEKVLNAWGALYGDIANVFITREKAITEEMANTPGGWVGRRKFVLEKKEPVSKSVSRFKFRPVDGKPTPSFKPGKYTTIWTDVPETDGPYGQFTSQPRHYTLALPRHEEDINKVFSISVKKDGLVSTLLHDSPEGSEFDLSAPFGCFDMSGVEKLWLNDDSSPVVFISAGVGITPVLAMLENIYVTHPASWLHASENGADHPYRQRLRQIAAVRNGELQRRVWYNKPLLDDGPPGSFDVDDSFMFNLAKYHFKGLMNLKGDFEPQILHLHNKNTHYYMCGPPPFMDVQRESLKELGVDEDRIHWEGF